MAKHLTQGHLPGTLYGCPACESECYCDYEWSGLPDDLPVRTSSACVYCADTAAINDQNHDNVESEIDRQSRPPVGYGSRSDYGM